MSCWALHKYFFRKKKYMSSEICCKEIFLCTYLYIRESAPCKCISVSFQTVFSWRGKILNKLLERPNSIHIRRIWVTSNALFSSPTINLFPTFCFLYKTERLFYRCMKFHFNSNEFNETKAELLQEGIFFLIHLFARDVLVVKKLKIGKTKPTFIISVLKVEY